MASEDFNALIGSVETVTATPHFRILRFVAGHQQIDRLQQQFYSDQSGMFWQDVPIVHIGSPDENPE